MEKNEEVVMEKNTIEETGLCLVYLCLLFAGIVVLGFFVVLAIFEMSVALDFEPTKGLVGEIMWAGSVLWIAIAISAWVEKFKNKFIFFVPITYTVPAICSVGGMYVSSLEKLAMYLNGFLSLVYVIVAVWFFYDFFWVQKRFVLTKS